MAQKSASSPLAFAPWRSFSSLAAFSLFSFFVLVCSRRPSSTAPDRPLPPLPRRIVCPCAATCSGEGKGPEGNYFQCFTCVSGGGQQQAVDGATTHWQV